MKGTYVILIVVIFFLFLLSNCVVEEVENTKNINLKVVQEDATTKGELFFSLSKYGNIIYDDRTVRLTRLAMNVCNANLVFGQGSTQYLQPHRLRSPSSTVWFS